MRLLELVFSSRKRPATARAHSLSTPRVAICIVLLGAMIASTVQSVRRALRGSFPDRCSVYHSSDTYLQALTGAANASQRVVDVMAALPKDKPLIVFERERDSGSSLLGMTLAYLSWPRDVRIQVVEGNQCDRQLGGIRPDSVAAIAFCDLPTPEWIHGGIRLGQTSRLLPVGLPNDRLQ